MGFFSSNKSNNLNSFIKQFDGGGKLFEWDGRKLKRTSGYTKEYEFDGKFVTENAGQKLFEWENDCLTDYNRNKKILEWDGRYVTQSGGNKLYEYDGKYLKRCSDGSIVYEIDGNIPTAMLMTFLMT